LSVFGISGVFVVFECFQNVLRLLDVGYKFPLDKNKILLQLDVEKFRSKEALHYFARNIPKGTRFL
jgi:hypothetical protein